MFKFLKTILADDDGTAIMSSTDGLFMQMVTVHRGVQRMLPIAELYFLSQKCGREFTNSAIIDELNTIHAQFFEEV